jgi:hypothetical protein
VKCLYFAVCFCSYFCQLVFLFDRVVDEVEALKAILMDELIVRTNERLVLQLLACYESWISFAYPLWLALIGVFH